MHQRVAPPTCGVKLMDTFFDRWRPAICEWTSRLRLVLPEVKMFLQSGSVVSIFVRTVIICSNLFSCCVFLGGHIRLRFWSSTAVFIVYRSVWFSLSPFCFSLSLFSSSLFIKCSCFWRQPGFLHIESYNFWNLLTTSGSTWADGNIRH